MLLLSGLWNFGKNTFTVESYIFDKKQKKKFIRQSNPRDVRFDKVNPISKLCGMLVNSQNFNRQEKLKNKIIISILLTTLFSFETIAQQPSKRVEIKLWLQIKAKLK
jgi:hypothetical protein